MNELEQRRKTLQETMNFITSIAYGVEQISGRGANGMAYVAGKKLGKKFANEGNIEKTTDLQKALGEVKRILTDNDCLWAFESFTPKDHDVIETTEDGGQQMKVVFRDCMIRQALFRYGHFQGGSLCYMMYGFFAGALEESMSQKAELIIEHAGQNACLKCLKVHPAEA